MSESLEFDQKWQMIKARFKERLTVRFDDIDVAWQQLNQVPDDAGALSALFHLVHSIAGSGATFGYDALSAAARQLEPLIDPQLPQAQAPLTGARRDEVAGLLELIRHEAHLINQSVRGVA